MTDSAWESFAISFAVAAELACKTGFASEIGSAAPSSATSFTSASAFDFSSRTASELGLQARSS